MDELIPAPRVWSGRSLGPRYEAVQHLYTVDANKPPPDNLLLVGELGIELADPPKLWVGVPLSMDATGKKLLYNSAQFLDSVHSFNTRQGDVVLSLADITNAGGAPILSPIFQGAPSLPTGSIGVTQVPGTNDLSLATTAFVRNSVNTAIIALPPYAVPISDTPPAAPYNGMLWFDSVNAQLVIRYQDPDSTQWVIANIGGGAGGAGGAGGVTSWGNRIGDVHMTNADVIAVLPGSNTLPLVNAVTAAIGTSARWALADHVHPAFALPSVTTPLMDGTAAIGAATANYALADHRHPVDTSRYDASNPAGYLTPTAGDSRYVNTTGDSMSGGLNFGFSTSSGPNDCSRHLALYGSSGFGTYGWSVTNSALNHCSGGGHYFYNNTVMGAQIAGGRLTVFGGNSNDPLLVSTTPGYWCRTLYQNGRTWSHGNDNGGNYYVADETAGAVRFQIDSQGVFKVTGQGIVYSNDGYNQPMAFGYEPDGQRFQWYCNNGWFGTLIRTYNSGNLTTMSHIMLDKGAPQMYGIYYNMQGLGWSFYYSDRRLKRNIKPATIDALDIINRIPVHELDLQPPIEGCPEQHWDCALIADEIAELLPMAYVKGKQVHEGVKPLHDRVEAYPLVCALVRAMQQMTERVAAIEKVIT